MAFNSDIVSSEQLGYLGLVTATIRELGIIKRIDARLELNNRKGGIVTFGRRAAAIVLIGLGFMNSRLSMTTHFFQDKLVAQLLGAEIGAEYLNDDCLGQCLDKKAIELGKTIWHLKDQEFKCLHDAEKAIRPILKSLKYHCINYQIVPIECYAGKGRPKDGVEKEIVGY